MEANPVPAVSVLMSVYNGGRFLTAAADSICGQTLQDLEFVVVDDGSTDDSAARIAACRDPRIRLIRNEKNLGLCRSLNRGLKECRGEYVARMDADDVARQDRLHRQYRYLRENPQVGVLGTAFQEIDGSDRRGRIQIMPALNAAIEWKLPFCCPLIHPSVMYRRALVLACGGYDPGARHVEDVELWSRLVGRTRFSNLSEPLIQLRKHGSNITNTEEHRVNAAQLARKILSGRLKRDVSGELVSCIRYGCCPDSNVRRQSAELVLEAFQRFVADRHISPEETKAIRRDVARRLFTLSVRSPARTRMIAFALLAHRMDPLVALRVGMDFAGRVASPARAY